MNKYIKKVYIKVLQHHVKGELTLKILMKKAH